MDQIAANEGFELHGPVTPLRRLLIDLWRSRGLVRLLARRDFAVRYRRPTLGVVWAVGFPLVHAVVLAVVFTQIVRIRTPIPYAVFVLAGVVPWAFFATTVAVAVRSITSAADVASKVYFPRAVLPLAAVGSGFYGFIPAVVIVVAVAAMHGIDVGVRLFALVPATLLLLLLTSAFGLVLAAAHVYFRDVAYIVQAVTQAWFYGSAIFYPLHAVDNTILRTAIEVNPVTGVVELFRAAFTGTFEPGALAWSVVWTIALSCVAVSLYRRHDRVLPDLL